MVVYHVPQMDLHAYSGALESYNCRSFICFFALRFLSTEAKSFILEYLAVSTSDLRDYVSVVFMLCSPSIPSYLYVGSV